MVVTTRPQPSTAAISARRHHLPTALSLIDMTALLPPQLQSLGFRSCFQGGRDLALANGILERGMIAFGLVCVGYRRNRPALFVLVA